MPEKFIRMSEKRTIGTCSWCGAHKQKLVMVGWTVQDGSARSAEV